MRSVWRLCGLLPLLAFAGGCDSTQPLQLDQQTFQLEVRGIAASINTYDVWDMYEDANLNEQRDADEPLYLFCTTKDEMILTPRSVPFPFKIQISVIRAGQTEREAITSTQALDLDANLTLYDDGAPNTDVTGDKGAITIEDPVGSGLFRTFRFVNPGRMVSAAAEEIVAATSNPLYDYDSETYKLGDGLCSTSYPGEERIDMQPQPWELALNKGDTLVVELRRGTTAPVGLPLNQNGEPALKIRLLLNGREVTVRGEVLTSKDPDDAIAFSYTAL